jgi:hypothetical protein
MKIRLTFHFVIAFVALIFFMHEAHEIVHTVTGRLICGCWGKRDFNVWDLCEGCFDQSFVSLIPTYAGPIFTFLMLWIGALLLKEQNTKAQKSFGLALIFGSLASIRILNALFGMGDEIFATRQLLGDRALAWTIGFSSILMITGYPLYKAYITIANKRRLLWFLGLLIIPIVLDIGVVLFFLNTLLENKILSEYWILGSPMIVTLWTFLVTAILVLSFKGLFQLGNSQQESAILQTGTH